MNLAPIARNRLEMALRNNGYHIEHEVDGVWLAADATAAPGRCYVAYADGTHDRALVATSLCHVSEAFSEEGGFACPSPSLPIGAVAAFITDTPALPAVVRRLFELSRALPTAPLDRFRAAIQSLSQTETTRLVSQRIGQDIFRNALMDLWANRCAVTGLEQPELLRASHMKPWADCANDAERLNPYNGLPLAAHWDAAFDRGLVTFEDDGSVWISTRLSDGARQLLLMYPSSPPRIPFCVPTISPSSPTIESISGFPKRPKRRCIVPVVRNDIWMGKQLLGRLGHRHEAHAEPVCGRLARTETKRARQIN